jgi:hypothetical protein
VNGATDRSRKLPDAPRVFVVAVRVESATAVRVGDDMRVAVGADRLRVEAGGRQRVIVCQHPRGHHSGLAAPPDPKSRPVVLFANRPTAR